MADKSKDPTITTGAPKVSDADHSADQLAGTYKDMPDDMKPDPTTVAQVQDVPDGWPTGK